MLVQAGLCGETAAGLEQRGGRHRSTQQADLPRQGSQGIALGMGENIAPHRAQAATWPLVNGVTL